MTSKRYWMPTAQGLIALILALALAGCNLPLLGGAPTAPAPLEPTPFRLSADERQLEDEAEIEASSSATGSQAAFALDGDAATFWAPVLETDQHWLQLDLGRPTAIGEIRLTFAPGSSTRVQVLLKAPDWASEEYVTAAASQPIAGDPVLVIAPAEAWTGIQYVRIEVRSPDEAFGLQEIELLFPEEDPYLIEYGDQDGDGVLDDADWCPETPGELADNGC